MSYRLIKTCAAFHFIFRESYSVYICKVNTRGMTTIFDVLHRYEVLFEVCSNHAENLPSLGVTVLLININNIIIL